MPDAPVRQIQHGRFVPITRRITTEASLEGGGQLNRDLRLRITGDQDDPSPFSYYGTDIFGNRGWFGAFGASGDYHSAGLVPDPGPTAGIVNFLREDGTWQLPPGGGGGGTGTVTSFSAGTLSPIFTTSVATPTTTPALSFALSNAAAHTFLGNNTGSPAAPAYATIGLSDLPASILIAIARDKTIYVDAVGGDDASGLRQRVDKPFKTLLAAIAVAVSGDVIILSPGTHVVGNNQIIMPAGVHIIGGGKLVTTITSSYSLSLTKVGLLLGTNSLLGYLTYTFTGSQPPMGCFSTDTAFTGAEIRGVKVNGTIDTFQFAGTGVCSFKVFNCELTSTFDVTSGVGGGVDLEIWDSIVTVDGQTTNPIRVFQAPALFALRLFNVIISSKGAGAAQEHISLKDLGGSIEAHNVRLSHDGTGTPAKNLSQSSGTLSIDNVSRDDGAALTTTGTITELSRYLVRDKNLSDLISAATARTNLGLVIGTNVQAWDADLDALAALGGTNTIYYRSAANTWTPVSIGGNLSFAGGTLNTAAATPGTVTSIATTSPITGGTITTTGTIALNVGVDHAFTALQSITVDDANNAAITNILDLVHTTTGTAAIGAGTRLRFRSENASGPVSDIAFITSTLTNATSINLASNLVFSVSTAGSVTVRMQLSGAGGLHVGGAFDQASGIISAATGFMIGTAASPTGTILISDGAKFAGSTPTYPNVGTTGAVLIGDGTNIIADTTPTLVDRLTLAAGTTTIAPLVFQSGTNLTTPVAGSHEYDGVQHYMTTDTTGGRAAVPCEQYFHLNADLAAIGTIANFFGTTSNISLVANAYYEIEIYCFFLNTTAGTVTWTFTNSAAPTSQDIVYEMSPATGIVAPAGSAAAYLMGNVHNDATAAKALTTTASLTTAVNHFAHFKIFLQNGAGTSLKIQATKLVGGTITPQRNSWWRCRRLSPNNIGTFAA